MSKRTTRFAVAIALAFSLITSEYCWASGLIISSFEDLTNTQDILQIEKIEVDADYLGLLEEYVNGLRREHDEFVEYQHDDPKLIPPGEIVSYQMRYRSGNAEVVAFISAPADYQTNKYPVLIFNRGGNGSYGKLTHPVVQNTAQYGFIVLATQYRGVDGGTGRDEFGGADVDDVIKLIDFVETFSFTNGKKYMYGWSRGAMQTYIVLSRDHRIDAAVAGAGPTDLLKEYEDNAVMRRVLVSRIGALRTHAEEYRARSAIYWPEKINTPLFIVHGTDDEKVMVDHSQKLYGVLSELGKDVKLALYPGMGHGDPAWAFEGDHFFWLKQH